MALRCRRRQSSMFTAMRTSNLIKNYMFMIFPWKYSNGVTWSRRLCVMSWLLPRSPVPRTTSVGTLIPVPLLIGSVDVGLALPFLRSLSRTMSWYVRLVRADPCTECAPLSISSEIGSNIGILMGWSVASLISGWFVSQADILEFDMMKDEFWERKSESLVTGTRY